MRGPENHPDGPGRPIESQDKPRPSGKALSSALGVFAGSGRGARIGAVVGTCGCFLVMMVYTVHDSVARGDGGMPLDATMIGWVFVAVWFLVISLIGGGVGGAILGAMVGAFLPVRRGPR